MSKRTSKQKKRRMEKRAIRRASVKGAAPPANNSGVAAR